MLGMINTGVAFIGIPLTTKRSIDWLNGSSCVSLSGWGAWVFLILPL
jgi:hypothetical protein